MEKYLFNVSVNDMDIWPFRFSTLPLILPTLVFHNTWVRKNRKKAPYEILNLLYNLWCFFCFRDKLQMLVDGAWEKDNIKTAVCVCVHLVLLLLDWLWKSKDSRSYGEQSSSVNVTTYSTSSILQFIQQDVFLLVLLQNKTLNIHSNVCMYFVQIVTTV